MISRLVDFLKRLIPKNKVVRHYEVGQLYQIPDSDWKDDFAHNIKHKGGFHPGLLREINPDGYTLKVVPGTTKDYKKKCVFKTKLTKDKKTYFLLQKVTSMTTEEMDTYRMGWLNVEKLDKEQMHEFRLDFKNCFGRVVNES